MVCGCLHCPLWLLFSPKLPVVTVGSGGSWCLQHALLWFYGVGCCMSVLKSRANMTDSSLCAICQRHL